ncbi:EmrB/QacA subfamily drug resistance transporter [Streptomyces griseochromogenes]|uniref:EmrB/QacA subfamily drug resistance transporter n=1 Tax=Streptomyces griseochromogenes TaxID=68214 RepID=A0A1B1AVS1_9ACTN|nr:MFS transporter [Streptomyces griseochromogenes]ANP50637.1 multidrug MFS transporter [Streptomyces griseochromogenes]MBP2051415.1 EmrB/QacA subfamily drug resistance transporter [Streptomyces griseochromogenes]
MRTWGTLTAVCLGTFMLLLDVTIVVVALPDMAGALHASLTDLQWVVDGYALALAALLLGAGAAADILGRRRVHVAGVVLFAVASLLCGLASGPGTLVAARALQGVGAAAMFATTLPLLGSVYQGARRSAALGVWGAVSGGAAAVGPVLGGLLTEGPGWRWIFFVNLPVSVVEVWLTLRVVPESRGPRGMRVDWAGTAAFAWFAGGVTYAVVRAGEDGWTASASLTAFACAALALVVFVLVERRADHPLLDLALLRKPAFVGVMAGAFAFNGVAFGVTPYLSIWMQTLLGMSPVRGGLTLLPMTVAAMIVAVLVGRLLHGVPARLTIGGGLLLIGSGNICQAVLDAGSGWTALVPGFVLVGAGTGFVSPTVAGAALAAVPGERAGMAGGAVNTVRQLGYALGVAVFGTVLTSRMTGALPHGAAHDLAGGGARTLRGSVSEPALRAAFASGLNGTLVAAGLAGIAAGALVLVLVRTPRPAPTAAEAAPREPAAVTPRR